MLTSEEKEILSALKEQMDDEQKALVDSLPEAELKGMLKEAKKESEKQMNSHNHHEGGDKRTMKEEMQRIRDMPSGEYIREYGNQGIVGALFLRFIAKMTGSKAGCGCLIVIAIVIVMLFIAMSNT